MSNEQEARALAHVHNMHGIAMKQEGPYETLRKDHVAVLLGMIGRLEAENDALTEQVSEERITRVFRDVKNKQPSNIFQVIRRDWTEPIADGDQQIGDDNGHVGEDQ